MTRHWMPLYIADYLSHTAHLGAMESGAYLHLIMHYWQTGGLPEQPHELARIAKVSFHNWKKISETIQKFFHSGWRHKRVDDELLRASEISDKRRNAARARHRPDRAIAPTIEDQLYTQSQSQSQKEDKREEARLHENEAKEILSDLLAVLKLYPPDSYGMPWKIEGLLARGFSRETILAGAAKAGPGKHWNYIVKVIESENAERSAPAKQERPNGKTQSPIMAACDNIIEHFERRDRTAGENVVGLLPHRRRE